MSTESQQRSEVQGNTEVDGMLPRGQRLPTEPERSKDALVYAVSHLLAAQAEPVTPRLEGGVPSPRRFRARFLADYPGQMLAPEDIAGWIDEQATKDGPPSWWLDGLPVGTEQVETQKDGTVIIHELRVRPTIEWGASPVKEPTLSHRFLWYSMPESSKNSCPVHAGGALDELRHLSLALCSNYDWTPPQATTFVLTGMVPVWDPTSLLMSPNEQHSMALLVEAELAIYGRDTPEERDREEHRIEGSKTDLRIRGRRAREMSVKHLELAVFTAWRHEREKLTVRMAEWNARYPEWAYRQVTNFGWDSKESQRRVWERMKAYIARGGRAAKTRRSEVDTRFDTNP